MKERQRSLRGRGKRLARGEALLLLILLSALVIFVIVKALLVMPPRINGGLFLLLLTVAGLFLLKSFKRTRFSTQRTVREIEAFVGRPWAQTRVQIAMLDDMLNKTPREFEEFVGVVMEAVIGYTDIQPVGGSSAGGADLFARDRYGRRVVVQCKRYNPLSKRVGSPEMQSLWAAITHHQASEGWLVTTSSFTPHAKSYAFQHNGVMRVLDGAALVEFCQQHQEALQTVQFQRMRKN